MTLTEFLLARIAEREMLARDLRHQAYSGPSPLLSHGGGTLLRDLLDPEQMLAECAAKRAILDLAATITGMADEIWNEWPSPHVTVIDGDVILRALALPYADREGYDEAWRP